MFTPELFRAKAAEYKELAKTANDQDDAREFERRERSFALLADNEQWLVDHYPQTLHAVDAAALATRLRNLSARSPAGRQCNETPSAAPRAARRSKPKDPAKERYEQQGGQD